MKNSIGEIKILANIKSNALLERRNETSTRYIIAVGFDRDKDNWSWEKNYDKFANAFNDFINITFSTLQEETQENKVRRKLNTSLYLLENSLEETDMSDGFEEFLKNIIKLDKNEIALYNEYANQIEIKYPSYKEFIKAELDKLINTKKENLSELENQYLEIDNHYKSNKLDEEEM